MAWTDSKIFASFLLDHFNNDINYDFGGTGVDTFKVALYNNNITPDNTAAGTLTRFNTGAWVTTSNEVISTGTYWPTGGLALSGSAVTQLSAPSANVVKWSASTLATGGIVSLSNFAGCLIYDNTQTNKNGICYNYFGGVNTVVSGTFTVVWSSTGIMSFTT